MLDKKLIPTPLIDPKARPAVKIVPVPPPVRFQSLHFLFELVRWYLITLWLRVRGKYTASVAGQQLRTMFERMGPFWIKLGQLLSLRNDLFPKEYCSELAQLQFQAQGFPPETARQIIESELGGPLEHYFDDFEEQPIAAASIAQVHRARLRFSEEFVVIKVQRPDILRRFTRDLQLIKTIIHLFQGMGAMPFMRWDEMLWELEQMYLEEIDYRFEAANLRRMRKSLKDHKVIVPRVHDRCCTSRIIVMEYIPGVMMTDFLEVQKTDPTRLLLWLRENDIDPVKTGERLVLSFFRQLMEDNLVHGDLHPGNILLLRESRLAFIDMGTIGSLEKEMFQKYSMLNRAMAEREYQKAADLTLLLCPDLPVINLAKVREAMVRVYRAWEARTSLHGLPYGEKSIANLGGHAARIMLENGIGGSWALMKIGRTWATLDASLMALVPNINFSKTLRRYHKRAERRAVLRGRGKTWTNLKNSLRGLAMLVDQLSEQALFQGAMIRRQAQVFQTVTGKVSYFFAVFFRTIGIVVLAGLLVLGFDFLHAHHNSLLDRLLPDDHTLVRLAEWIPHYEYELGILFLFGLLLVLRMCHSLQQRFAQPDVRAPDATGRA